MPTNGPRGILHICQVRSVIVKVYELWTAFGDAAGIGSVAGGVLAMLERKPLMPHMAGTAASAAICLSFYGGKHLPKMQAHDP